MTHAFLSYARRDDEAVRQVIAELDRTGVTYWVDQRDIPVSVPWFDEVREAILRSSLFVVCESLPWYESQACRIEKVTADGLGKQIVHIDVVDQPPAEAAASIARAIDAQTELDRAHTTLLIRSSAWERAGRAKHDLAGGVVLRSLRDVAKVESRPLTTAARSFLEASIRRHRHRTWATRLGALVVALAVLTVVTFHGAQQKSAQNFAEAAKTFTDISTIHERTERDPYDGLRTASALVHSGNSSFMALTVLQDALDIPVPDRSFELPGAPLVGFGTGVADADPVVFASDGHRSPAGTDWGTATSSVAADQHGQVIVASTPAGPVATVNDHRVKVPCAGTATAVSTSGSTVTIIDGDTVCTWRPREQAVRRWTVASGTTAAVADQYVHVGRPSGELAVFTVAGAPVAVIPGTGAITSLVTTQDDRWVAVIRDGPAIVEVRDIASGSLYRAFPTIKAAQTARFSPDGRTLAIGQGDAVELWDIATGTLKTLLRGGTGKITALAWSADGTRVWAIASEHRLTSWSWRLGTRPYDDPATWFVALSDAGPDGRLIATTQSGALISVDPVTSTTTPVAQTGATKVITAAVDATHTTAILGAANTATVRDLKTGRETSLPVEDCVPVSAAFVPGKPLVVIACGDGDATTVDTEKARVVARKTVPFDGASAVAVGPHSEVYISSVTGVVQQTNALFTESQTIYPMPHNHSRWRDIAVADDGNTIALVGDGTGNVGHTVVGMREDGGDWSWHMLLLPTRPGQQARAVVVNHDGSLGAIGFSDGTVQYWIPRNANPGLTYTETPGAVRGLSFATAGNKIVAATRDGAVDILPGCPSCGEVDKLTAEADKRLASATNLGLTTR